MSFILLVEQAAPETPSANQVVLYPKSDGLVYSKDDTGTERAIAQGIATQAQQETGTDVTVAVTSGRQQFHPSAAKGWALATNAGTTLASYNVTSITDTGTGDLTVVWATDFSSVNFVTVATNVSTASQSSRVNSLAAAGSSQIINFTTTTGAAADTDIAYAVAAFGDQ